MLIKSRKKNPKNKTRAPNPSPIKQKKNIPSKESNFLPQTSINMIQTPKTSVSNFFKVPLLNTNTNNPPLSNRSNSKKKRFSPHPSRSLQNSSKRKQQSKSQISLSKGLKNIFDNSMYLAENNNNPSKRTKIINKNDNNPSLGHTQRSFWVKQEIQEPMDFIEKAEGFKGNAKNFF